MVPEEIYLTVLATMHWQMLLNVLDELAAVTGHDKLCSNTMFALKNRLANPSAMIMIYRIDCIIENNQRAIHAF